jgi:flagellar hook-associated protein 3 FlgL
MRISLNERVEVGGNANDLPHRQLAQAYVMIGKIGTAQLNSAALDVVLDKATALVGSAISGIGALQARMGASQHRLTSATLELGQTSTLIDTQLTALERADPYVAATQVNTLLTQLQASYAATARIQKISILNYI